MRFLQISPKSFSPIHLPCVPALLALLILLTLSASADQAEISLSQVHASSPRKAMRTFMDTMTAVGSGNPDRLAEAVQVLDLDALPVEQREAQGIDLAKKLFEILNSFTFKLDAIPEELASPTYQLPVGMEKDIVIVLVRTEENFWKFSYEHTLRHVPQFLKTLAEDATRTEQDTTIDPLFRSPRDTMAYFLHAMTNQKDLDRTDAQAALDLSRIDSAVRREIARERVVMLKFVLDRYKYIDLVEISNDPGAPPYIHLRNQAGNVIMERISIPGSKIEAWKFSAATVQDLPRLYDAFKDKPVIEGVENTVVAPVSVRVRDYMRDNFPTLLTEWFILENWQWLGIFCVIFLGIAFSRVLSNALTNSIRYLFTREELTLELLTEKQFITPVGYAIMAWIWWLGLNLLGLPLQARLFLLVTVKLFTAIAGIWAAYRLMDVIGDYLAAKAARTPNKFDDLLAPLVTKGLKVMAVAFGLVFIADIFAWDIDKIMAGLGLGGLAFALAAKDTIANVFGSLTILIDRPFQIGDWVTIGTVDGSVETVGVRSTRIRTFYDSVISVPNSSLLTATIDNMGARKYRRISSTFSISFNTPPEKIEAFCEAVRQLVRLHPYTRKDYFHVYLSGMGPSELEVMLYVFLKTPDWATELREKHRLFLDILRVARKLGVEFAFPTRTLFMRQHDAPLDNEALTDYADPFVKGRQEAEQVVHSTLGDPVQCPPPVTF